MKFVRERLKPFDIVFGFYVPVILLAQQGIRWTRKDEIDRFLCHFVLHIRQRIAANDLSKLCA